MRERQLVVIRHAKAADGDADRERPLRPQGIAQARDVGRWLAEAAIAPDRVVTSPARRTVQTWAEAAAQLQTPTSAVTDERLYVNTVGAVMDAIHETPSDVATLVIVGHNPSSHAVAVAVDDGTGNCQQRDELAAGFPTAAVAWFAITDDWGGTVRGTLRWLHVPHVSG